jgi:peptidoglycan/LPS O-acetylase OafA/YrhL
MTNNSSPATPRFPGVDVLRGLAIISVILLHSWLRLYLNGRSLNPLLPHWLLQVVFRDAIDGVPVFFAVSGFLITYTCIRRFGSLRSVAVTAFYRIRFARIAPMLLLLLAVLSILHLLQLPNFVITPRHGDLPHALFAALTFHLSWYEAVHGYLPPAWDILWSLSVEEMFYLFFPLLCVLLLRRRGGPAIFGALLAALIIMGPFARTIWTAANPIWQEKSYLGGTDCIAFGCITAIALAWCERSGRKPSPQALLAMVWTGIILVTLMAWPARLAWRRPIGRSGASVTVFIVGICLIIVGTVLRNRPGRAWSAPLRWFGSHSYELYLTHEFVIIAITNLCLRYSTTRGHSLLLWAFSMLLFSAPLGWLTAKYISNPMNRRLRGVHPPQPSASLS